eukprot:gene3846-4104_t
MKAASTYLGGVWVEQVAGQYLTHTRDSFLREQAEQQTNWHQCLQRMHNLTGPALGDVGRDSGAAVVELIRDLVTEYETLHGLQATMQRLTMIADLVAGAGAQHWGMKLRELQAAKLEQQAQPDQQQQQQPVLTYRQQQELWRSAYRAAPRELKNDLEVSFVEQAEMVFTTLSSSARDILGRLARPFELVLIDEAAQAAEVAALQPLVYGAQAVVMVGDPQQLPATIFSAAAKQLALERSLFERLAAGGCPVNLLRVQYRMHPAIRRFPSQYFYHNSLVDAPSGQERVGRGKSVENELEARMAVALYGELRRLGEAAAQKAAALAAEPPSKLQGNTAGSALVASTAHATALPPAAHACLAAV